MQRPASWIDVRVFKTEGNARVTASCLSRGFLRVQPREGDSPITVRGRRYIATASPVETDVAEEPEGWGLRIRHV